MLLYFPADGPPVVAHYDISDTNSDPEVVNVDNLLAAAVVQEHSNSLGNQDSGSAWRTRGLLNEMSADTGLFKSSDVCASIAVGVCPFLAFSIFTFYTAVKAPYVNFAREQDRCLLKRSNIKKNIYSKIQVIKIHKYSCNIFFTPIFLTTLLLFLLITTGNLGLGFWWWDFFK